MGKSEYEVKARQLLREQEKKKSEVVTLRASLAKKVANLSESGERIFYLERECERLRMLLWLRHGCDALYGDYGEMQCSHCMIDFKRESAESIEQKWYIAGYEKIKQALGKE